MDVLPGELLSSIAQWLTQEDDDSRTVLDAAVDLCSLQSVCRKTRTCASSSFDRLIPLCKSLDSPEQPFPGMMMCPQYCLIARPANVPPLVYNCVLNCQQEIQTAKRKEILEACLAKKWPTASCRQPSLLCLHCHWPRGACTHSQCHAGNGLVVQTYPLCRGASKGV